MIPILSALLNAAIVSIPLAAVLWLALRLTPTRLLSAAARYILWWTA